MNELTQDLLVESLDYCKKTGVFTWKKRPLSHFKSNTSQKIFTKRFSGKQAGSISSVGKCFYRDISVFDKRYRAHRLAYLFITGEFPAEGRQIDHINGDGTDNRWKNLRECSASINYKNSKMYKNNTSGANGVWYHKIAKKYVATLYDNGICHYLGLYDTVAEASKVREVANKKHGFTNRHGKSVSAVNA